MDQQITSEIALDYLIMERDELRAVARALEQACIHAAEQPAPDTYTQMINLASVLNRLLDDEVALNTVAEFLSSDPDALPLKPGLQ